MRSVGLWQLCIRGQLGNREVVAYDFACEGMEGVICFSGFGGVA
jgi:hypothetical protein